MTGRTDLPVVTRLPNEICKSLTKVGSMNQISNNNYDPEKSVALIILLLTIFYLAVVNYHLPFMTMDELRSISDPLVDRFYLIGLYGRPSQIIGLPINYIISFQDVEFLSLTPRFITMIAILFALVALFQKVGVPRVASIWVACFALITHEIDWQHNGLVAFFGGYNLFLAMFLIGVLIVDNDKRNFIRWVSAYILILLSFASEFFVGLMVVYLAAYWIEKLDSKKIATSPHLWALLTYAVSFVILKASYQEEVHSSRMINYLAGSSSVYDLSQICQGALIYFVNSIPLYGRGPILSSLIAGGVVALTIVLVIIVGLRTNGAWRERNREFETINAAKRKKLSFSLYSIFVCLVFAPPILMSLQPMKLEWALTGASARYAFSFYTWIGLIGLLSMMLFLYPIKYRSAKISIGVVVAILVTIGLNNNLEFLSKYNASFFNWKEMHERLINTNERVVDLPISLFEHPYIVSPLTPDRRMMDQLVEFHYKKSIKICRDKFDFSGPLVLPVDVNKITGALEASDWGEGSLRIDGFHGVEDWGRWTAGSSSKIYLNENLRANDVVEFEISGAFSENSTAPTKFKIEDNSILVTVDHPRTVAISVEKDVQSPVITIIPPKPQSPREMGQGADSRVIGIMVKSVRVLRPDHNGRLVNISQGCF
jgi:hypothetical protein